MKQLVTQGIVLSRTNFGEADRIVTFLTPGHGKLRLMAKGVRKSKSKLAGGIELFSVSDITFIRGRGDIGTLVSSRLKNHYAGIVRDIDRTMLGYDLIKRLNKAIEDEPEEEYFDLLRHTFEALEEESVPQELTRSWFNAQLLRLDGHAPNLMTDTTGDKLEIGRLYNFSFDDMAFIQSTGGRFDAARIKLLRLLFSNNTPQMIVQVQGIQELLPDVMPLVQTMARSYIRA